MSSTTEDIEDFLATRAVVAPRATYAAGAAFGAWRVTAFLGKGGSGEVYRVENAADGRIAALKVHVASPGATDSREAVARRRFGREAKLLAASAFPFFPRFFEADMDAPAPYIVTELLEPVEPPKSDKDVAKYLLAVCEAVRALHRLGYVHRDVKPRNIMRRAGGELVLIDFGLVKESGGPHGSGGASVTTVDGRAVGVGTPRYAAPEQFSGGEVSPAADVHALGMLANECFCGRPRGAWERIVNRSTSSIPARRFPDIDAFMRAVRFRHLRAAACLSACAMLAAGCLAVICLSPLAEPFRERAAFRALCENVLTNVVTRQLTGDSFMTNELGVAVCTGRSYRLVTNTVPGVVIRLAGGSHRFNHPIVLDPGREYWLVGPGTLDADVRAKTRARLHLEGCAFTNRTGESLSQTGIRYVFGTNAHLNLVNRDREAWRPHVEGFDGAHNRIAFRRPEAMDEVAEDRAFDAGRLLELETK